jgi:hypothetical protein
MEKQDFIATRIKDFNFRIDEINLKESKRQRNFQLKRSSLDPTIDTIQDTEKNLSQSWNYQINLLISIKAHEQLHMTELEYRKSLPQFREAPVVIKEIFPIPLIVDPRLSNKFQINGFDDDIQEQGGSVNEIFNREGVITPDKPYQIWVKTGTEYAGLEKEQLIEKLSKEEESERGLTFPELLGLYRANINMFFENRPQYDNIAFDYASASSLLGSTPDSAPTIYHNYYDLQEYGEFQVDNFNNPKPRGGWPTCWNEIVSVGI